MNKFNEKEFLEICRKLNAEPRCEEITLRYEEDSYFSEIKHTLLTDRRGEVVFCVIRPNGRIITITSSDYPKGIFRIPTGGIGHDEDIIEAAHREAMEELGLETEIRSFEGVLKFRFEHGSEHAMFYSYIFIMNEKSGRLLEDAEDDEISEVWEADLDELSQIAGNLLKIEGRKKDWGRFRYETTNAVLEYLKHEN